MPEPDEPEVQEEKSLEKRAARGALWVLLGYGGSQLVRLLGNLILTRLLFEEAFGLMALLSTVLQGLELFSDIGIGPSIIQNEREDAQFVNTAWTLQVGRGVALFSVAGVVAVPFSWAYEEPQLSWLLPLAATTALVSGFNSTRLFTLNRKLNLGRIEIVQIGAQVVGLVTMVGWALVQRSVVALVAGSIVTGVTRMVLSHVYLPGERNRLAWDKEAVGELVRFGRWIFLSTLLTFLAGQSDRLIFGKMVPLDILGVYSIGVMIAMLPSQALGRLSMQVIFPVYSRVRVRDGHFRGVFETARVPLLTLGGWGFAGLLAGGPAGIELAYDDRYIGAGWVVQYLAFSSWLVLVAQTYGAALLADGKPKWVSFASAAKLVGMVALIPAGYWLGEDRLPGGGFAGAVAGYALSELFRYLTAAWGSRAAGYGGFGQDMKMSGLVLLTGGGFAVGDYFAREAGLHVGLRCLIVTVGVTAAWAPLGWPMLKKRLERRRRRKAGEDV